MTHITVRVGSLPGRITEIALNGDRAVATALEAAGLDPEGYEIRVDGYNASLDQELRNGQTVLLVKKVKGNALTVRVGQLPGVVQEIALEDGATVADALAAAELDSEGYEVRVNGTPAEGTTSVSEGQTVLLIKKIKGNADHIMVRVGQLPGVVLEIALNGDRTVSAAIAAAELDSEGYEVRVNGTPAEGTTLLTEGQTVLLIKKIKGNAMTVRAGQLPGVVQEVALEDGATVADALAAAELDSEGYEIRVNGTPAETTTALSEGQTVLLIKKIKGN